MLAAVVAMAACDPTGQTPEEKLIQIGYDLGAETTKMALIQQIQDTLDEELSWLAEVHRERLNHKWFADSQQYYYGRHEALIEVRRRLLSSFDTEQ